MAASPLLLCIVLALLGKGSDVAIIAAVYVVFGLVFVLTVGWLLSLAAKKAKEPLLWTVICYSAPALLIDLAILGLVFV